MKKVLSIFLAVIIIFMSSAVGFSKFDYSNIFTIKSYAAENGTCGEKLTWSLDNEGTLTISGKGNMIDYNAESSPWYSSRSKITNVIIGNGVTSIGKNAFYYCVKLISVTIPNSVTSIGYGAFFCCSNLLSVTLPDEIVSLGEYAFAHCTRLNSITLSNSIKSIGENTFLRCLKLKSITIPNSVTSIGDNAFENCTELATVNLPTSLIFLGSCTFSNCDALSTITIPNSVTRIGAAAFCSCNSLTNFVFPNKLVTIESGVFNECTSLVSITIPSSVKIIEDLVLVNCTNFKYLFYTGTKEEWDNIAVNSANDTLFKSFIHHESTGHNYSNIEILSKPTCTEVGTQKKSCPVCGVGFEETIPATGHNYSTEYITDIEPTCTKAGTKSHHCTDCGHKKNVTIIPAHGHNYVETWVIDNDPTCTKKGSKSYHCSICNNKTNITEIPTIAHTYGEWLVRTEPRCVTKGEEYRVCSKCKCEETRPLDALGHKTSDWYEKNEPTCTTQGLKIKSCAACGVELFGENIPINKDNHNLENGVCTRCNYWPNQSQIVTLKSISNSTNGVKLQWCELEGATEYYVYRKTYSNKKWGKWVRLSKDTKITTLSYIDKTVKSGTNYKYTIKGVNGKASKYDTNGLSVKYLATPKISSVSKNSNGVTIKWNKISTAKGYYVYRKIDDGKWSKIGTIKSNSTVSFTDKNTKTGIRYTYTVRAYNGKTLSSYTSGKMYVRLATPTLSSVSNNYGGVTVKWGKVSGAQGYYVYRKVASEKKWTKIATIKKGTTVSYTDKKVIGATKYAYTVKAYSCGYTSSYNKTGKSVVYVVAPSISSVLNSTKGVTVKWNKISGADGYYLYRKAGNETKWTKIATLKGVSKTSYSDKNVVSGTKYIYTVKTYDGKVASGYNKIGTTIIFLTAPTISSITGSVANGVTLKWREISGATKYIVYRKTGSEKWVNIASVSDGSTTYTDKNVELNTNFTYTVRATTDSYKSSYLSGESITVVYTYDDAIADENIRHQQKIDEINTYYENLISNYQEEIYIKKTQNNVSYVYDDAYCYNEISSISTQISNLERRISSLSGSSYPADVAERRRLEAQVAELEDKMDMYYVCISINAFQNEIYFTQQYWDSALRQENDLHQQNLDKLKQQYS